MRDFPGSFEAILSFAHAVKAPRLWASAMGGALLSFIFSASDASAEELKLSYETAWGHFTLLSAEVRYREAAEHYRVEGRARTEGIWNLLFDWQGEARTEGRFGADGRKAHLHLHEGIHDGERRFTKVVWDKDLSRPPRTDVDPEPDAEEVTAVDGRKTLGASDPFTVLLGLLDAARHSKRCEGEARVWDGRRLYDLRVEHAGIEMIPADRPWSYAGPAIACHWKVERLGGFRRDPGRWRAPNDRDRRVLYLADWGFGFPVPVRAEIETSYGTVISRLRPNEDQEEPLSGAALTRDGAE